MKKTIISDEVLIEAYIKHDKSMQEIAQIYHVGLKTLKRVLDSHGVNLKKVFNKHIQESDLEKLLPISFNPKTSRAKEMIGKKFNMLTVVKRVENIGKMSVYFCICDCGNTRIVRGSYLRIGRVKDCGCISQQLRAQHIKEHSPLMIHGDSKTDLYAVWTSMKARCFNKKDKNFKYYGGRGISIYSEWIESYKKFKQWAIRSGYKKGLSIERIDVNGNYCPENCTWITLTEQTRNKRNTRKIFYKNIGKTAAEWAIILNLSKYAIYNYAKLHNWELEPFLNFKKVQLKIEDLTCLK